MRWRGSVVAGVLGVLACVPLAHAQAGTAFEPQPRSTARFAVGPTEQVTIPGTTIAVDVTRPVAKPGGPAPGKVPVILMETAYRALDTPPAIAAT